jgi:ParB family transcriptional regulator, chromosome partitioning protein
MSTIMAKPKALGRGLSALLAGDEAEASARQESTNTLAVTALKPGKFQPRSRMDQAALQELSHSIKAQGLLQPILVRPLNGGGYEILAGERRWRAAQLAGLGEVPVVVKEVEDSIALQVALIENIQREDLNPLEEAGGIKRLIDEFKMTHEAAALAVGRSRSAVTNLLRLLNLAPRVREMLLEDEIEMGHARALLALAPPRQEQLARQIVEQDLSVREVEKLAGQAYAPVSVKAKSVKAVDRDVARLEEELSEKLGTRVQIRSGAKGKGRLEILYRSFEQLDVILGKLRR